MKRKTNLHFFDISSNIEELPENELFELKVAIVMALLMAEIWRRLKLLLQIAMNLKMIGEQMILGMIRKILGMNLKMIGKIMAGEETIMKKKSRMNVHVLKVL